MARYTTTQKPMAAEAASRLKCWPCFVEWNGEDSPEAKSLAQSPVEYIVGGIGVCFFHAAKWHITKGPGLDKSRIPTYTYSDDTATSGQARPRFVEGGDDVADA